MQHLGTQTLETERLILRLARPDDAEDMFNNWASSEKVTKYMTWTSYTSVEDSRAYIKFCIKKCKKNDNYDWIIEFKENGQAIGSISSTNVRNDTGCIEVGYCLGDKYWHRGIMTEAFGCVIKFFFEEVGANRIQATHDVRNPNSGKVMEKCGLVYEGTLRQEGLNNQGICDTVVRAILREDYMKAKGNE